MEIIYEVVRIKQEIKGIENVKIVRSPDDVAELAFELIGEEDREIFLVMCLNTKNHVVAVHKVHIGELSSSLVHPREVFKSAILNNAQSIIVSHNHPSTIPTPSNEDVQVTERLKRAGDILGIGVLDHVIVTPIPHKWVSLKEKGYI